MAVYYLKTRGSSWEYFWYTLGWGLLMLITIGLATPFFIVWNFKWFAKNIKIVRDENKHILDMHDTD